MRLDPEWTPHTVGVQRYEGEGGNGPIWADEVDVADVYVRDLHELITDASGTETVSSARVYFNLTDTPPLGSRIRIWRGDPQFERVAPVVKLSRADHPAFPGLGVAYLR